VVVSICIEQHHSLTPAILGLYIFVFECRIALNEIEIGIEYNDAFFQAVEDGLDIRAIVLQPGGVYGCLPGSGRRNRDCSEENKDRRTNACKSETTEVDCRERPAKFNCVGTNETAAMPT